MPIRETGRFQAEAPDGRIFTVVEYTTFTVSYFYSKRHETRGASDYRLDGGQPVSRTVNEGEFMVFPDGPLIRRSNRP